MGSDSQHGAAMARHIHLGSPPHKPIIVYSNAIRLTIRMSAVIMQKSMKLSPVPVCRVHGPCLR